MNGGDYSSISTADLPESLRDIAGVIGLSATVELAFRYGGVRLYIPLPKSINEDHPIAQTIGLDAAQKLAALAGPQRLVIPRALKVLVKLRNEIIYRDSASLPVPAIARKHNLTERRVRSILNFRVRRRTRAI